VLSDIPFDPSKTVVALCGGVGGAKLALGLQHLLEKRLTVVVNVGDDFEHKGLRICPDIDTVLYTLSGLNDEARGWGRSNETWNFMEATKQVGGDCWFALGDRDLALHVERTLRLADGATLTEVIAEISQRLRIKARIVPVTDDRLRTKVETGTEVLDFQRYFVERRCEPVVRRIFFEGADISRLNPLVREELSSDRLGTIIICPSNPYLSIDPILAVPGIRNEMKRRGVPVVAVSPIIAGRAIKGPTAKIMDELRIKPTSGSIAQHYSSLIDGLLVDHVDAEGATDIGTMVHTVPTLMTDLESRIRLARETLAFAGRIAACRI